MRHPVASRAPAGQWVIASTVLLGSFVSVMDISIVNVAMPQMLRTFGVALDEITWVSVAYSIAEILLVTMAAWCSARLGRKRFYPHSTELCGGAPTPFEIPLQLFSHTLILGPQLQRPSDLRVTHAKHRSPDPRKPDHYRRFSQRSHLLSAP
jgi:hypothetical protein